MLPSEDGQRTPYRDDECIFAAPLKQYVDRRVSSGIYGSASEFVREAIREKLDRDRERHDVRDALTTKLLKGLVRIVDGHMPVPAGSPPDDDISQVGACTDCLAPGITAGQTGDALFEVMQVRIRVDTP